MATYRFMDGVSGRPGAGSSSGVVLPSAPAAYSGDYSTGLNFVVKGVGGKWLDGYWWYVPYGGQTTAGATFALWQPTSAAAGVLVPNSGVTAGTFTAATSAGNANGWNYVPLATPLQLSQDVAYCAVIAYASTVGFPQQKNVFGSGDTFATGITNSFAYAYGSSNSGAAYEVLPQGATAPAWQPQMPYDTGTTNASAVMPTINDSDDILWLDVQLDDTPPTGYTTRLWPNYPEPYGMLANSVDGEYTLCNEFDISEAVTLLRLWFYSPTSTYGPAATALPTGVGIFDVGGGTVAGSVVSSPSWSGAAGSGWVSVTYSGGLSLPAGNYLPYVTYAGGSPWYGTVVGYYTTGEGANGITNGVVSAPSNANAHGPSQGTYSTAYATAPNVVVSNGEIYFIDLEVSTPVNITGVGAEVTVSGGVGTPSGSANVTGAGAEVTLSGGVGAPSGSANATGVGAVLKLSGGVGTPSGSANVAGSGGSILLSGGVGTPSGSAGITGVGAILAFAGGVGTPQGFTAGGADVTGVGAILRYIGGVGWVTAGQAPTVLCQRVDSGSMAPVAINATLINMTRLGVSTPPTWATCWQVASDPFNPGEYLLVGWLTNGPYLIPGPND